MSDTSYCLAKYGDPAQPAFQKYLMDYVFPAWLAPYWPPYDNRKVTHQWLNKDIIKPLEAVFQDLIASGLVKELKTCGGGNLRYKRGLKPVLGNLNIHS